MNGENCMLVTDQPFEVQELRKIIDRFRGIYGTYFKSIKKKPTDDNM